MAVVTFTHRHLIILGLGLVAAACGGRRTASAPSPSSSSQTVERFLAAANAQDLDGMAMLWGTRDGPEAVVRRIDDNERTQRLTIMQRLLRSDNHMITAVDSTFMPDSQLVTVAMTQGTRRFVVPFTVVPSRAGGWLIQGIKLENAMPAQGTAQPATRN